MQRFESFTRWAVLGIFIGIISGLGSVLFFYLLELFTSFLLGYLGGYQPPNPGGLQNIFVLGLDSMVSWRIPLILTIGGLISGLIVYGFAPEAEGHGTDAYISAFHYNQGKIRGRIPLVKAVASSITIGSGGSAGAEGPIIQIGAGFGSWLVDRLKLSDSDRRIAIICGAAGGLGSIFKSPLGGAIFALEVLYTRDIESRGILPAFISSAVAYSIFGLFFGFDPIFINIPIMFEISSLFLYALLGLICAPIAIIYVSFFYATREKIFQKIKIPNYIKPAIGGLCVGIMAMFVPEILGIGYGWIQLAIYGKITLTVIIILIIAKIIATSFTIGSGGSGGVFGPSLFIGAMIGGSWALILKILFPTLQIDMGSFVIIGMICFISASSKVLIAPIIMVSEITGNYYLLLPAMAACALSFVFSKKFTIYKSQVLNFTYSPVYKDEFTTDILDNVPVGEVMTRELIIISPKSSVKEVDQLIKSTEHAIFPVVKDNKLIGIVGRSDVKKVPTEQMANILVDQIMIKENLITITPEETISKALDKIVQYGHSHIPVVDKEETKKVLGILTKHDIIKAHDMAKKNLEIKRKSLDIR